VLGRGGVLGRYTEARSQRVAPRMAASDGEAHDARRINDNASTEAGACRSTSCPSLGRHPPVGPTPHRPSLTRAIVEKKAPGIGVM
jgi:hypothetical protein